MRMIEPTRKNIQREIAAIPERVTRGVKWLDENGPENWREKVVINDLNMESACRCVLGQVFHDPTVTDFYGTPMPGFWRVIESPSLKNDDSTPTITTNEAIELGFDCPEVGFENDLDVDSEELWITLQNAWVEELSR